MGLCLDRRDIFVMQTKIHFCLSCESRLSLLWSGNSALFTVVTVLPLTFCIPLLPSLAVVFGSEECGGKGGVVSGSLSRQKGRPEESFLCGVWEVFQAYDKEKREITANCQRFQGVKQDFTVFVLKNWGTKNSLLQFDLMNPEYLIICMRQFPKLWLSSFAMY